MTGLRAREQSLMRMAFPSGGAPAHLPGGECAAAARAFFCRGGKFLRPRLLAAVYARLRPRECELDPGATLLMEAVECFHRASLVHDDIQDCSGERYGAKAVHLETGVARAIALGDWLVAAGYRCAALLPQPQAVFDVVSRCHAAMCAGQYVELSRGRRAPAPDAAALHDIYARKTGAGFALAAALGALAAGAGEYAELCENLGGHLGVVYQCRDDLRDGDCPSPAAAAAVAAAARGAALALFRKLRRARAMGYSVA